MIPYTPVTQQSGPPLQPVPLVSPGPRTLPAYMPPVTVNTENPVHAEQTPLHTENPVVPLTVHTDNRQVPPQDTDQEPLSSTGNTPSTSPGRSDDCELQDIVRTNEAGDPDSVDHQSPLIPPYPGTRSTPSPAPSVRTISPATPVRPRTTMARRKITQPVPVEDTPLLTPQQARELGKLRS